MVEHDKTLARVAWSEVLEIFAYKEDRFTFDDICLGFRVREDGTFWMVSEDFVGEEPFPHGSEKLAGQSIRIAAGSEIIEWFTRSWCPPTLWRFSA